MSKLLKDSAYRSTKILFHSGANFSPFIKKDFDILEKHFDVVKQGTVGISSPLSLMKAFFKIFSVNLTFSWFGNSSTFWIVIMSKILQAKSVVVAGGGDAADLPEINYGGMANKLSRIFTVGSFLFADRILSVSENTREEVLKYVPTADIKTIYHGIDSDKFHSEGKKEEIVLTVGYVSDVTLKRKGLRTFVETAKYVQNVNFVLVGEQRDNSIKELKSIAPENLEFTGWVSSNKLLDYMQRAKVYVQVSAHEGFGVSLGEAMACECIPIVTRRGAIPEVVGGAGIYVSYNNPKKTAIAVGKALRSSDGKEARKRIVNKFPFERREKQIIELVRGLR